MIHSTFPADPPEKLRELVAEVAAAYFSRSPVGAAEVASVISQIANSLGSIGDVQEGAKREEVTLLAQDASAADEETGPDADGETSPALTPAQVRKTITPDALISFEDGKPYRTLRLHLASRGLTPDRYREKWGLPADYPMVAPNYSKFRSQMAKRSGLGRRRSSEPTEASGNRQRPRKQRSAAPAK